MVRPIVLFPPLLFCLVPIQSAFSQQSSNEKDKIQKDATQQHDQQQQQAPCSIYLAQSSIPNAGFGVYTTKSIQKDQFIQPYPNAPSIMVTDFYEGNDNEEDDWNHDDYLWEPVGTGAFEADEVSEIVPSFGSLCNYHTVSDLGDFLHSAKNDVVFVLLQVTVHSYTTLDLTLFYPRFIKLGIGKSISKLLQDYRYLILMHVVQFNLHPYHCHNYNYNHCYNHCYNHH